VLLVATVVVLAAAVAGGLALGGSPAPGEPPPTAALSLSASGDRVTIVHRAGDPIDVRAVELRIRVDGDPLDRQPPVPFFSARGFRPGPTGPFNSAADPTWTAGETASLRIAATNEPVPGPGSTVEIAVVVDGTRVAALDATVT
jgi:FlaG/FlaF family flagellin (archaellin)